jgi:hypothetical protein
MRGATWNRAAAHQNRSAPTWVPVPPFRVNMSGGRIMKRNSSVARCLPALLAVISGSVCANGVSYFCSTTADLRAGGTGDSIRISNQSGGTVNVGYRIVNQNGSIQGEPVSIELGPKASATRTIGQVFQQAGVRFFNPNFFVQIGSDDQNFWPVVQSTYRNASNGQVMGLLFSCGDYAPS